MNKNSLRRYLHSIIVDKSILKDLSCSLKKEYQAEKEVSSGEHKAAIDLEYKLVSLSNEVTVTCAETFLSHLVSQDLNNLKKINMDFHSSNKSIIIRINFEDARSSWFQVSGADSDWLSKTEGDINKIFDDYKTANDLLYSWKSGLVRPWKSGLLHFWENSLSLYISLALLTAFLISIPLDLVSWGEFVFIKYICALVVSVPCLYGWQKFLRWLHPWFETIGWRIENRKYVLLYIVSLFMMIAFLYGTVIFTTDILFNLLLKIFGVYSIMLLFSWFKLIPGRHILGRVMVLTTIPADGENGVKVDAPIVVEFSTPVSSVSSNIVKLGENIPIDMTTYFSRYRKVLTLKPNTNLDFASKYEVTIQGDVTAPSGAEMVKLKTWSFKTIFPS